MDGDRKGGRLAPSGTTVLAQAQCSGAHAMVALATLHQISTEP